MSAKYYLGGQVKVIPVGSIFGASFLGRSGIYAAGDTPEVALANLLAKPEAFTVLAIDLRSASQEEREARRFFQAVVNDGYVIIHGKEDEAIMSIARRLFRDANMIVGFQDFGNGSFMLRDINRTALVTLLVAGLTYDKVYALNDEGYWRVATSDSAQFFLADKISKV